MTAPLRQLVTWVGLTLAAAGVTGSAACAQPSPSRTSAWTFVYTVTGSANGRRAEAADLILDVAVWHGVARIGVRSGGLRRLAGDSGTILVRSSDSSVVVVNAARREAIVARHGELASLVGFGGTGAQFTVSDITSSVTRRGAGPPAFSFATQRVEATQRYALQVTAGTVIRRVRTDQQMVLVLSRDLDKLDRGFRSFVAHFLRALDMPQDVREQLQKATRPLPAGFPVQSLVLAATVSGNDTLRTERRGELSAFRAAVVDTATFAIPAGFRVTEMSRLLQTRPRP